MIKAAQRPLFVPQLEQEQEQEQEYESKPKFQTAADARVGKATNPELETGTGTGTKIGAEKVVWRATSKTGVVAGAVLTGGSRQTKLLRTEARRKKAEKESRADAGRMSGVRANLLKAQTDRLPSRDNEKDSETYDADEMYATWLTS
jgi:hypothetical protein